MKIRSNQKKKNMHFFILSILSKNMKISRI
jgi:hypothetical protein